MTSSNEVSRIRREEFDAASVAEVEADNALEQLYRHMQDGRMTDGMSLVRQEAELDVQRQAAMQRRKTAELNEYGFILGEDSHL
jgi:hypothetical protein